MTIGSIQIKEKTLLFTDFLKFISANTFQVFVGMFEYELQ